jgi:Flp pilus assembly protein protease CpaA
MNIDEVTNGSGSEITPATLASYLATLPSNTSSSPHDIALKISSVEEFPTIGKALSGEPNKYVKLDLTGSKVISIGDAAFYSCENLTSITIPNSVTSIGNSAFYGCNSLASITIPNSVTSIGSCAFYDCNSLASVIIPDSITSIEEAVFSRYSSIAKMTIPNSVTRIGDYAFYGCERLTSVTIPLRALGIMLLVNVQALPA